MNPKHVWAGLIAVGILALAGVWLALRPVTITVLKDGQASGARFGGTTGLDSLSLVNDLSVGGNSTMTGTLAVTGAATFASTVGITGTTTFSGAIAGVPSTYSTAFTASTSTPCSLQNTSGLTRFVTNVGAIYTNTTAVGSFVITVGTSTDSGTTSTTPFISALMTTVNGSDVITPTSTMNVTNTVAGNLGSPSYGLWRNNEWLIWKAATTTNNGYCKVSYY